MKVAEASQKWTGQVRCTGEGNGDAGCGLQLILEDDDLYNTYGYSEKEVFVTFQCPRCLTQTDLAQDVTLPGSVKEKLWAKRNRHVLADSVKDE